MQFRGEVVKTNTAANLASHQREREREVRGWRLAFKWIIKDVNERNRMPDTKKDTREIFKMNIV